MEQTITITVEQKAFRVPLGTRYLDVISQIKDEYEDDIVLVQEGNTLRELRYAPRTDVTIIPVTVRSVAGMDTYQRSVTLLFLKALYDVLGYASVKKVLVQFSVSKGYYCELGGDFTCNTALIQKIEDQMRELVRRDIVIDKFTISTDEAIEMFHRYGMYDKEKLFRFRRSSQVNLYAIEEYKDYFYGYMVPSTGYLKYFSLHCYQNGVVLQLPTRREPKVVPPFEPQDKIASVLLETERWCGEMGVQTVGDLNETISQGKAQHLILVQEALQEMKVANIAKEICDRGDVRFVMIAGPSSSGKTTFSHRLSVQLQANGKNPHPIAVDNYFVNREDNPKDEFGNYNYEDLESIDIKQFDADMNALLRGETVSLPYYNFKTGLREYRGEYLTLKENDILVIEGIHCLNEKLYATLPKKNMYKVYISALTQLNVDEHNRVHSTDGRLIRRLVRDAKHRGTTAGETLARWESVRKGEEKNIFPYQETADVVFNSAQVYELSILKLYAEPLLFGVDSQCPEYAEANRLLKFLDYFLPLLPEYIPSNSILQEFIGNSIFHI